MPASPVDDAGRAAGGGDRRRAPRPCSPRRSSSRRRGSCRAWASSPPSAGGARRRCWSTPTMPSASLPFSLPALGLESALVTGGGYKYLQLGEGNAFLRLPQGLDLRPVVTGWFAEFWTKTGDKSCGAGRLRARRRRARRRDLRSDEPLPGGAGLRLLRRAALDAGFPARGFAASGRTAGTRVRCARSSRSASFGASARRRSKRSPAFSLSTRPAAQALAEKLLVKGVLCDARGRSLRLGPAPYLSDAQIERAVEILGEVARALP